MTRCPACGARVNGYGLAVLTCCDDCSETVCSECAAYFRAPEATDERTRARCAPCVGAAA